VTLRASPATPVACVSRIATSLTAHASKHVRTRGHATASRSVSSTARALDAELPLRFRRVDAIVTRDGPPPCHGPLRCVCAPVELRETREDSMETPTTQNGADAATYSVERLDLAADRSALRFAGELRFASAFRSWQNVRRLAADVAAPTRLDLDLSGIEHLDGAATALLLELRADLERKGVASDIVGAHGAARAMLDLYGAHAPRPKPAAAPGADRRARSDRPRDGRAAR